MNNLTSNYRGYIIASILGAIAGGLIVTLVTRAIPKMMSQMMAGMMQNMMAQMNDEGCDPPEMCQKMMAKCAESRHKISE